MQKITSIAAIIFIFSALYWSGPTIVTWLMQHAFVTAHQRTLHRKDLEKRQRTIGALMANLCRVIVIISALYALSLQFFDKDILAPLFASAGIIGVAFGFGAQSLIKDFLSGIFIISENQFRVGDVVEIEGASGTVEQIGFRSTVLRDVDGNVHFFPNGMVQHIINKTMGYSMARFTVAVTPETNIDEAAKLINDIGLALAKEDAWKDKILEAPHYVMMGEFSSTAVNLIISGKTQPSDQWSVIAEMRQRMLEAFEKAEIRIGTVPVTQITVPHKKKK